LRDVVRCKRETREQAETRERRQAFSDYLQALGLLAAPEPAQAQAAKGQKKPNTISRN